MTTDWLTVFESSDPMTLATKGTIARDAEPIVSNVTIVRPQGFSKLIDELNSLNARWQKASELEAAGKFIGISKAREERICAELRHIIQRATTIWETLAEEAPELLNGLVYLEPVDCVGYSQEAFEEAP